MMQLITSPVSAHRPMALISAMLDSLLGSYYTRLCT
jgi:hypothetical protein